MSIKRLLQRAPSSKRKSSGSSPRSDCESFSFRARVGWLARSRSADR